MNFYPSAIDNIPKRSMTNHCIMLDLDATLISTQDQDGDLSLLRRLNILNDPILLALRKRTYLRSVDDVLVEKGSGDRYDFWGVTRPHLKEFLVFCFSYFKIVAVWSAGQRAYVESIVDEIFKDIRPPHIVFTFDDLKISNDGDLLEKPIEKMISHDKVMQRYMSLTNTFAIDDRYSTFAGVNKDNGVLIPGYEPAPSINGLSTDDVALLQLKYWLLQPEVMESDDIRNLNKTGIFAAPVSAYKERLKELNSNYKFM